MLALLGSMAVWPCLAQLADETAAPDARPYRVEILIFANQDFSGNEELFDHGRVIEEASDLSLAQLPPSAPARLGLLTLEPLPGAADTRDDPGADAAASASMPSGEVAAGAAAPGADTALDAVSPALPPEPEPFRFRLLTPDEYELGAAQRSLERLSAYRPVLHAGWVQQGLPEEQATGVDLALFGHAELRGQIELYLSRFLHVELDIDYQPLDGPAAAVRAAPQLGEFPLPPRYHLHTERRLRSGELHYFDHPAFGVLVLVKPMPEPDRASASGLPAA
jgi:hypothetical protein